MIAAGATRLQNQKFSHILGRASHDHKGSLSHMDNALVSDATKQQALDIDIRAVWERLELPALPSNNGNISSPWRRDSEPSLLVGGEHNIVHDFGTGETLDSIGLVERVKKCSFPEAVEYLLGKDRISTPPDNPVKQIAELRQWKREALVALGVRPAGTLVEFPMHDGDGGIVGWQQRCGDGGLVHVRNGKDTKSKTRAGGKKGLFMPHPFPAEGVILVTEGETDCATAISAGHAATIGTPCAGTPKEKWLAQICAGRNCVLAPDPGAPGKEWLRKCATALHKSKCSVRIIEPTDTDLDKHLKGGADIQELISNATDWAPTPPAQDLSLNAPPTLSLSDLGAAERFKAQHEGNVFFDASAGCWRVWNGQRYARDNDGAVARLAHKTARSIRQEAINEEEHDHAQKLFKFALRTETHQRLIAMMSIAQTLKGMVRTAAELDSDPLLLNTQNCTVDLRTGRAHKHRRKDLITRVCSVEFDPNAKHPVFEKVLAEAIPDPPLRGYVQRLAGYTLTGLTGEEILAFVYGRTATAKSTFTEALKRVMGDYAMTADPETFLKKVGDQGARSDIARLAGARLVLTSETEEGQKMASALVKRLTGCNDTIVARFQYEREFEYTPQFTLWLMSNHRPRVDSKDTAIWRRIRVVPFDEIVPEEKRDPGIKKAMMEECGPAILAWAVQGAHIWQKTGLAEPKAVRFATSTYRESQDPLKDFVDECCIVGKNERAARSELRQAYDQWAKRNGIRFTLGPRAFTDLVRATGCRELKTGGTRMWEGLSVIHRPHDAPYFD